jgi:hypothetical protein
LRYGVGSAKTLDLPYLNIGVAKGKGFDRVFVCPNAGMINHLRRKKQPESGPACSLHVAIKRARETVVFVSDYPNDLGLPI